MYMACIFGAIHQASIRSSDPSSLSATYTGPLIVKASDIDFNGNPKIWWINAGRVDTSCPKHAIDRSMHHTEVYFFLPHLWIW